MIARGFALFDTAIGPCAIAWGRGGIVGIQLPERDRAATEFRMARRYPEAIPMRAPPGVDLAVRNIATLLAGAMTDLSRITLDMAELPDFYVRVYEAARAIPVGETRTYGDIARQVGDNGAARAVGGALGRNPFAIVVPCHRVLAADGKTGGFSASGGTVTKLRLLTIERARTGAMPGLFDAHGGLPFRAA